MNFATRGFSTLIRGAAVVAALIGASVPCAQARVHWSVGIGVAPYGWGWGPGWYGYPPPPVMVMPPPQPPVVVMPQTPTYVIPAPVQGVPPPSYWYYCANPPGYYPQVPSCPGGWTPVLAQPTR